MAGNHDLGKALAARTPLVIGVVLILGLLLLLFAIPAPLIAAVGVVTNRLAAGAAFGVATTRARRWPAASPTRAASSSPPPRRSRFGHV